MKLILWNNPEGPQLIYMMISLCHTPFVFGLCGYVLTPMADPSSTDSKAWGPRTGSSNGSGEGTQQISTTTVVQNLGWPLWGFVFLSSTMVPIAGRSLYFATIGDQSVAGRNRPMPIAIVLRSSVLQLVFPKSKSSLKDLDQAVAASAGATVLGFHLLPIVSAWFKLGLSEGNQSKGS